MAAYKYLFTDKEGETVEVFDVADLNRFPEIKARRFLQSSYGKEDEELTEDDYKQFDASDPRVPCFHRLSGWELSGWCEWHDIMFEAGGTLHWGADGSWSRVRLTHEVYGDNIYSFAELPSDEARAAAADWMWNHGCFDLFLAIGTVGQLSMDVCRHVANGRRLLFTADGTCGFFRTDCNESN